MIRIKILGVLAVLFLLLPFVKQCDGINRKVEETPKADSTAIVVDSLNKFSSNVEVEDYNDINEIKNNKFIEYFSEKSSNVFDLAFQLKDFVNKNNSKKYVFEDYLLLQSCILSILLILNSFYCLIRIFRNKIKNLNRFYFINLLFILLIMIINFYLFINRIGQIKIGFYLLIIINFYLFLKVKLKNEDDFLIK